MGKKSRIDPSKKDLMNQLIFFLFCHARENKVFQFQTFREDFGMSFADRDRQKTCRDLAQLMPPCNY